MIKAGGAATLCGTWVLGCFVLERNNLWLYAFIVICGIRVAVLFAGVVILIFIVYLSQAVVLGLSIT